MYSIKLHSCTHWACKMWSSEKNRMERKKCKGWVMLHEIPMDKINDPFHSHANSLPEHFCNRKKRSYSEWGKSAVTSSFYHRENDDTLLGVFIKGAQNSFDVSVDSCWRKRWEFSPSSKFNIIMQDARLHMFLFYSSKQRERERERKKEREKRRRKGHELE